MTTQTSSLDSAVSSAVDAIDAALEAHAVAFATRHVTMHECRSYANERTAQRKMETMAKALDRTGWNARVRFLVVADGRDAGRIVPAIVFPVGTVVDGADAIGFAYAGIPVIVARR